MQYLTTKKVKANTTEPMRGFVIYRGASVLDGQPIAVIATLKTSNKKTGAMIQTWIIRDDVSPIEASKAGKDSSICGSCPHKHSVGGSCYVNLGHAPLAIYKALKANKYPVFNYDDHAHYFAGKKIRLGAYGDPAAVPFGILNSLVAIGSGHTGYTHQIEHANFDARYLTLCQVSADSPKQAVKFQGLGANTFRVAMAGDALADNELECLADSKGLQCADCMLCDGTTKNIAITVHGSRSKRFKTSTIAAINIA